MHQFDADIVISGGGVAGLTAAAAFGSAGFSVVCVDPTPPVTNANAAGADLRTTAFLQPAVGVLQAAGLWERLAPHAAALNVMRIVDAGGPPDAPLVTRDFVSAEISDQPFGWNLPNWLLRREMVARLDELPNVRFLPGLATQNLFTRSTSARVTLSDGQKLRARMLIAADGRNSPVRAAVGIDVKTTRYGQKALSFAVTHPNPHENISTEVHRSGGPFTLVPLPDLDGQPCSAVVWMAPGPEIARLAAMDDSEFTAAANARSAGVYGPLTLAGGRGVWPIISQLAHQLSAQRTALVAEAAHVIPPIGAQGLNMSLADIASLLTLSQTHGDDLGGAPMLAAYHKARHAEVRLRVTGIDALNRASMVGAPGLQKLRAAALTGMTAVPGIRHQLMRAGLGAGRDGAP